MKIDNKSFITQLLNEKVTEVKVKEPAEKKTVEAKSKKKTPAERMWDVFMEFGIDTDVSPVVVYSRYFGKPGPLDPHYARTCIHTGVKQFNNQKNGYLILGGYIKGHLRLTKDVGQLEERAKKAETLKGYRLKQHLERQALREERLAKSEERKIEEELRKQERKQEREAAAEKRRLEKEKELELKREKQKEQEIENAPREPKPLLSENGSALSIGPDIDKLREYMLRKR